MHQQINPAVLRGDLPNGAGNLVTIGHVGDHVLHSTAQGGKSPDRAMCFPASPRLGEFALHFRC